MKDIDVMYKHMHTSQTRETERENNRKRWRERERDRADSRTNVPLAVSRTLCTHVTGQFVNLYCAWQYAVKNLKPEDLKNAWRVTLQDKGNAGQEQEDLKDIV